MNDNPRDEEWQQWLAEWRAGVSAPPELLTMVRRAARRQRLSLLGALVATVGGISALGFGVVLFPGPVSVANLIVVALLASWGWAKYVKTYADTWRAPTASTKDFVALTLRRTAARVRELRYVRKWLLPLLALYSCGYSAAVILSGIEYPPELTAQETAWFQLAALGTGLGFLVAVRAHYGRKIEQLEPEQARFEEMAKALDESET